MGVITKKDLKVVQYYKDCGNKLPKFSKHHLRCKRCWEKYQLCRGNLALMGGV